MKKILLSLFAVILFTGCYTTLYPPVSQNFDSADEVPDSTRQVIINNYYETTEYYQTPSYQRYSLLWGNYYWDPFYYDYGYYHWEPYYWYGSYYYYNPRSRYWYYYDPDYRWHEGGWTGGDGDTGDRDRVHKPGYKTLTNTPQSGSAPFISVGSDSEGISKPSSRSGIDINSGVGDNSVYGSPRIESAGKRSSSGSSGIYKPSGKDTDSKSSVTNGRSKKSSSSSSVSKPGYRSSRGTSSSSSSSAKSKSSSTTRSTGKSSSSESSSSNDKKSK